MDWSFAPPPKVVDGLFAVPIDITHVVAAVIFDAATQTCGVDATVDFTVGPTAGNPIFDLRQTITQAFIDGAVISPALLARHDFGYGLTAGLRIAQVPLAAGSTHTMRLVYQLGQPDAPSSQPLGWSAGGTRLSWDLWFSDLWPGRYLEMWLPSNLQFDFLQIRIDLRLLNTAVAHSVLTNGQLTVNAANDWRIDFPGAFTSLSTMLVLLPADEIEERHATTTLASSGATLHVDTYKRAGSAPNLMTAEASVVASVAANESSMGPYVHGDRFTTYLWTLSRSMEYDGATTSSTGALAHETFHSWAGRGFKPASQDDGWIDEGWTTYNIDWGGSVLDPFNFTDPPVQLCGLDAYARVTPNAAYTDGASLFAGLASLLGLGTIRGLMSDWYQANLGALVTTEMFEAFLLARSGSLTVVDAFHRFVYGFTVPGPAKPDLYIRDAADDTGVDPYVGATFWNSPDLWVRNSDDGSTVHQEPEFGQDNFIYARVRNRGTATAKSFAVAFQVRPWAGTEFVYPNDFLPSLAAAVGFNLAPGGSTIVKARWPAAAVPATGTHACLLASVYTPTDTTPAGQHVWDRNNLAQKNMTIVNLIAGDSIVVSFQLGSLVRLEPELVRLEIRRPAGWPTIPVTIVHRDPKVVRALHGALSQVELEPTRARPVGVSPFVRFLEPVAVEIVAGRTGGAPIRLRLAPDSRLDLGATEVSPGGANGHDLGTRDADLVSDAAGQPALAFRPGTLVGLPVLLGPRSPLTLGLKITAPAESKPGGEFLIHLVERNRAGQVIGGISVQVNVVAG